MKQQTYVNRDQNVLEGQLTFPEWVPGVLAAAIGTVLTMWRSLAVIDVKLKAMEATENKSRDDERQMSADLRDAIRTLQSLSTDVKVVVAEQGVINKVTNVTLEGIVDKLERHGTAIGDIKQRMVLVEEYIGSRK